MATNARGEALELEVARMFFDRELSKTEIAARLGISRYQVARLIDKARASGVVTIQFDERVSIDTSLAQELEDAFHTPLCVVLRGAQLPGPQTKTAVGRWAAGVVADLIRPGDHLGTGWGGTVAAIIDGLPPRNDPSIHVVQLFGGSTRIDFEVTPTEVAGRMARRLGATLHVMYAPAFVESPEIREALRRQQELAETAALFDQVNMALVGIGAIHPSADHTRSSLLTTDGFLPPGTVRRLVDSQMVGDIALYPYDDQGRFGRAELMPTPIGISLDQLRRVARVVAVAGGTSKGAAIMGALRSGLIDILVTDEHAARAALGLAMREPG